MTKKSKEEVAESRRKRRMAEEEEKRLADIAFEKDILAFSDRRQDYLSKAHKCSVIASDLEGWYIELDKLTKKSPADEVTQLQLETVNDLIDQVKQLITDDEFIGKVKRFVAAGDNPQYRDVIGVLRRLKQGLERFEEALTDERSQIKQLANDMFEEDIEDVLRLDLRSKYKREEFYDPEKYDRLK